MSGRNLGKCYQAFPTKYVVVDIETTGRSFNNDKIIEISAMKFPSKETFSSLVNPFRKLDPFITRLTGITDGMLKDAPPISQVMADFHDFAKDSVLVGHNIKAFDAPFLYDNMLNSLNIELTNPLVDTLLLARKIVPELENKKLATLSKYFHVYTPTHRALDDVKATADCLECLKKEAMRRGIGHPVGCERK